MKVDVPGIAAFIAGQNRLQDKHVGYCGTEPAEIEKSIREFDLSINQSFTVLYRENQIHGLIGFDVDLEASYAEVWGPFFVSDDWEKESINLWNNAIKKLPQEVKEFEFFYETKNKNAINFVNKLGAKSKLDHSILSLKEEDIYINPAEPGQEIQPSNYSGFIELHDSLFPNTYMSGQQIVNSLGENHKIFILESEPDLAGYIYVEVEPLTSEGNIHFFGVDEKFRGRGLGKKLLTLGTSWIFQSEKINSIFLCVDHENIKAINLYKNIGFQEIHKCTNFNLSIN